MQEKVWFKNSKGDKLCGILSDCGKDTPIIVLCHGYESGKNNKTFMLLEKILYENKISTFRFDIYGHYESEGEIENLTSKETIDDIFQAVDFVKSRGYKRIGLIGSSFSGPAAINIASHQKGLILLILKAPGLGDKNKSQ